MTRDMHSPSRTETQTTAAISKPLPMAAVRLFSGDTLLKGASTTAAVGILVMLVALVIVLFISAWPAIHKFGLHFLTSTDWRPNELEVPARDAAGHIQLDSDGETVTKTIAPSFGALAVIWGTVISSLIALVIAIPVSFGAALVLVRMSWRKLSAPLSFLIEFLAAIPSLAYGLWGLFVLAPFLQNVVEPAMARFINFVNFHIPLNIERIHLHVVFSLDFMLTEAGINGPREIPKTGRDMLCGGLVLAIMILPIITAISRDVLKAIPRAQIEGTQALGANWWQSSFEMLRYGKAALFGAVMLGLARATGETMAITMVIGNNNQISGSLFSPAQTMSSLLANEFAEANTDMHRAALTEVALVLLVMSLLFNMVARKLVVGRNK